MDPAPEYHELPSSNNPNNDPNNPHNPGINRTYHWLKWILLFLLILVSVSLLAFFMWPRNPELEVSKVDFKGLSLNTSNGLHLSINLGLLIEVNNPNYFGVDYDRVLVHVFYRGDELGQVNSSGGHISARDFANLTAGVKLESLSILKNAPQLISDVAQDQVPVSTSADFLGNLNIIGVLTPEIKVTISCELLLDPGNSSILSKECDEREISKSNTIQLLGIGGQLSSDFWFIVVACGVLLLVLLIGLAWVVWPKAPEITVEGVELLGFSADSNLAEGSLIPEVSLDINLGLHLKVRNRNLFGATYEKLTVVVYYSGYEVCKGEVGEAGEIPPRGTADVHASLNLRGAEIVFNSTQLLSDVTKRELPMNTLILFSGRVGIGIFKPHIKGAVAYDLKLDPVSNEILDQDYHLK